MYVTWRLNATIHCAVDVMNAPLPLQQRRWWWVWCLYSHQEHFVWICVIHMARSVLAVPALSGCFWRAKCKHACRTCCFEAVSCSPSSSELIGPTTIASKRNTPTLSVIVTIYMWLGYHIAHDLKWRYISSKSQCVAAHARSMLPEPQKS